VLAFASLDRTGRDPDRVALMDNFHVVHASPDES
jgi:hypothetical protein